MILLFCSGVQSLKFFCVQFPINWKCDFYVNQHLFYLDILRNCLKVVLDCTFIHRHLCEVLQSRFCCYWDSETHFLTCAYTSNTCIPEQIWTFPTRMPECQYSHVMGITYENALFWSNFLRKQTETTSPFVDQLLALLDHFFWSF